jgi:membrane-bound ClpP family serine protease
MSRRSSRRWRKKQLRYAAEGISIGLTGSLMMLFGMRIFFRYTHDHHIAHRSIVGLVVFTSLFAVFVYRLLFAQPRDSGESARYGKLAEFAKNRETDDGTKSA